MSSEKETKLTLTAEEAQLADKMRDRLEEEALRRFPGDFAAQQALIEDTINRWASITIRMLKEGSFDLSAEERRERLEQLCREFAGEKLLC